MSSIIEKYIERIKADYPEDDKLMIDLKDFAKESNSELLERRNDLLEALKPLISQFEKIEPLYFKDRVILENAKKAISKTESKT